MSVAKDLFPTLRQHREYIEAIKTLIKIENKERIVGEEELRFLKKEFTEMHEASVEASILADAFSTILARPDLPARLGYEKNFLFTARYITERIADQEFFEALVETKLEGYQAPAGYGHQVCHELFGE